MRRVGLTLVDRCCIRGGALHRHLRTRGRGTTHWQAMVSVAHTLVYDCLLSEATGADLFRRVAVPSLVIDSAASTADLTGMAATAAGLSPDASHRSLPG